MKKVVITLSADQSLRQEQIEMSDLIEHINHILSKRNINVLMAVWDGAINDINAYKEHIAETDICFNLYYDKFAESSREELETAFANFCIDKNPKRIYVYFKKNDNIPDELREFRDSFPVKYGHFESYFSDVHQLRAEMILKIEEYQHEKFYELHEGKIVIDGKEFVEITNLPFAYNNKYYVSLLKSIKKTQKLLSVTDEDDEDYQKFQDELQSDLAQKEKLENSIWDTALHIIRLRNSRTSERLERAIKLFYDGDTQGANALLPEKEIDYEVEQNIRIINMGEEGEEGLKSNIDTYILKAKFIINTGQYSKENENAIISLYDKALKYVSYVKDDSFVYERTKLYINYLHAIKNFKKGIEVIDTLKELIKDRNIFLNLIYEKGGFLKENSMLEESIKAYEYVLPEFKIYYKRGELSPMISYPRLLCDLGTAYRGEGRIEDSFSLLKESLDCFSQIREEDDYSCLFASIAIAELYIQKEEVDMAKTMLCQVEDKLVDYSGNKRTLSFHLYVTKLNLINTILSNCDDSQKEAYVKEMISLVKLAELAIDEAMSSGRCNIKDLDIIFVFCNSSISFLCDNDIQYNTSNLVRYGNKTLNGLYRILDHQKYLNYAILFTMTKLSNYLFKQDISSLKQCVGLSLFTISKKTIPTLGLQYIDLVLLLISLGIIDEPSKFEDTLKNCVYPSAEIKKLTLFKLEIVRILINETTDDFEQKLTDLYSVYEETFKLSYLGFDGNFADVMARFLNLCVNNLFMPENKTDLSLKLIDDALRLSQEDYIIDTKAEILCKKSQKEEALLLAKQVFNSDPDFYPDGNQYLYHELMCFEEWKQLFEH